LAQRHARWECASLPAAALARACVARFIRLPDPTQLADHLAPLALPSDPLLGSPAPITAAGLGSGVEVGSSPARETDCQPDGALAAGCGDSSVGLTLNALPVYLYFRPHRSVDAGARFSLRLSLLQTDGRASAAASLAPPADPNGSALAATELSPEVNRDPLLLDPFAMSAETVSVEVFENDALLGWALVRGHALLSGACVELQPSPAQRLLEDTARALARREDALLRDNEKGSLTLQRLALLKPRLNAHPRLKRAQLFFNARPFCVQLPASLPAALAQHAPLSVALLAALPSPGSEHVAAAAPVPRRPWRVELLAPALKLHLRLGLALLSPEGLELARVAFPDPNTRRPAEADYAPGGSDGTRAINGLAALARRMGFLPGHPNPLPIGSM
jgi:hypothetical protein